MPDCRLISPNRTRFSPLSRVLHAPPIPPSRIWSPK